MDDFHPLILLIPPFILMGFHLYRSLNRFADRKGGRRIGRRGTIWMVLLFMMLMIIAGTRL